ncbi:MAG TPA: hypothetical protein VF490_02555 [Chryseosolibacter sp.]
MLVKILCSCLAFLPLALQAQPVEVKKATSRIDGKNTTGYVVSLTASPDEVKNSLTKYLKALGKTQQSGDYIAMDEPVIAGKKYTHTLFATVRAAANTTSVWIGVPSGEQGPFVPEAELEKFVHDFGVAFQREKIQAQIDESMRALQAVEKQQSRLINQNKDLRTRMENNAREKALLEKSLEENKQELADLTRKLDANMKAQDSVATATGQIKKVVEMNLVKQKQVH